MNLNEDLIIKAENNGGCCYRVWEPQRIVVVLGRSNDPETEVFLQRTKADQVEVLKRLGGGGTVVLADGVLVVTIAKFVSKSFESQSYFDRINDLIINSLGALKLQGLTKRGISDICFGDRKILGSSIYRKKGLLFYQGSLLVRPDLGKICKYLRHPSKEPDYRQGRKHEEFLTTLLNEGCELSINEIKALIERGLHANLWSIN